MNNHWCLALLIVVVELNHICLLPCVGWPKTLEAWYSLHWVLTFFAYIDSLETNTTVFTCKKSNALSTLMIVDEHFFTWIDIRRLRQPKMSSQDICQQTYQGLEFVIIQFWKEALPHCSGSSPSFRIRFTRPSKQILGHDIPMHFSLRFERALTD